MKLHPFKAIRPARGREAEVISVPYDVVSRDEARQLAAGNPASFLHVIRPDIDLPDECGPYDDRVYAGGAAALRRLIAEGAMTCGDEARLYAYRLTRGAHVQIGVVGCTDVADYDQGRVKRHELTRRDKEDDRTRHVDTLDAQTGPVFLSCRANAALGAALERATAGSPQTSVRAPDGVLHEVWAIDDPATGQAMDAALSELDAFYIADGHHRAASASRVNALRDQSGRGAGPWRRFLTVVFPDDMLAILPYNRVVRDRNGLSVAALLDALGRDFSLSEPSADRQPVRRHEFAMYTGGRWYGLSAKPDSYDADDPVAALDVAILQDNLLAPVLGIGDPRVDERIRFLGGSRGISALEAAADATDGVAFALYPTSMAELLAVADAGLIMPPKSTWFEPKLASGLFVHALGPLG